MYTILDMQSNGVVKLTALTFIQNLSNPAKGDARKTACY
jgi:hypothetical protein